MILKLTGQISHRKGISMLEEYGEKEARKISGKISNTLRRNKNSTKNYDQIKFNNIIKIG